MFGFVVAMSPTNCRICAVAFALQIMSVLRNRENFQPQVAKLSNLQNLRELQLVFYSMNTPMLSHIYGFLRMCRCSQLRNLFLEVSELSAWYTLVKCSSILASSNSVSFAYCVRSRLIHFYVLLMNAYNCNYASAPKSHS